MKKWKTRVLLCGVALLSIGLVACSSSSQNQSALSTPLETLVLKTQTDEQVSQLSYALFNAEENELKSHRSNVLTPTFYIYAGKQSQEEVQELVNDLQMSEIVREWAANVYVISPLEGDTYNEKDAEAFLSLVAKAPVTNVKVIGVDDGATFVNNELAPRYSYLMAGVFTIGGEADSSKSLTDAVPAYLSQPGQGVQALYIQASEKANNNPRTASDLQQVVVADQKEDKATAFQNAWSQVLSKNYRMHNDTTEFYNANPKEITTGYGLEPVVDFNELKIDYKENEEVPLNGKGSYTWYEYVPRSIADSKDGTVPLIVSLHGFGNDPRLQGDTSGWVELVAKENAIVVSPEWQDKEFNYGKVDGLGEEGVLDLINYLKEIYPQIDPSRVYLTGLSAGGSKTALWTAKHPDVFAAGASLSAPGVDKAELTTIADQYKGSKRPYLYLAGDHDFFQLLPVDGSSPYGQKNIFFDDPNVSMFEFIQAYQKINGLAVADKPDLSLNTYFGVSLVNQQEIQIGSKDALVGGLEDSYGKEWIRLVAVKDLAHWNYRPEAAYVWEFFKNYRNN